MDRDYFCSACHKDVCEHTGDYIELLRKERDTERERSKILVEALEFYAGELVWDSESDYINNIIDVDDVELIERVTEGHDCSDYYGGKTAREALEKYKAGGE